MKKSSRLIALLMCLLMFFSIATEAQATTDNKVFIYELGENVEVYLDQSKAQTGNELTCLMSISKDVGEVSVLFSTTAGTNSLPTEIGVRDFVFQEKGLIFWNTLYSNSYCNYNDNHYSGGIVYKGPEEGKKYRAIGTHYAIIDGEEHTYIMISSELEY